MRLDENETSSSTHAPDYSREYEIPLYGDISELVKCDKCEKIFKKKSYLRAHLLKIHEKKDRRKVANAKLAENDTLLSNVITCAQDIKCVSRQKNHSTSEDTTSLTEMPPSCNKNNLACGPKSLCIPQKVNNAEVEVTAIEETISSNKLTACADKPQPSSRSLDLDKLSSLDKNNYVISILPKSQAENRSKTDSNVSYCLSCPMCCKTFKKSKRLKLHVKLHSAIHICHMCGHKSKSLYYLKVHLRRHNKEFTEICKIYNKGFYGKSPLRLHMTTHADRRSCVCKVCNKSFHNQLYLNSHIRTQHSSERRRKFTSEICNFQTFYKHSYKQHLSSHTGAAHIQCKVCGKLIREHYMKIHIRIHTNEKPEVCKYCSKAFRSRPYLVQHQKTHTYGRFECADCNKNFNLRRKLSTHLKLVHKAGK
ncbi:zinc finger protein 846-like [Neodiprion pinetum]|uniref:zinc finger protein 846-like n=1 Tax=Neodiprion pinetum TaxID=441929 RepID=UPI00371ECC4C